MNNVLDRATKTRTYLAENTGVIVMNTQKAIDGMANPSFALEKIREESFNTKDGEATREIRTYMTQPTRTRYTPIFGEGNETGTAMNPQTGEAVSGISGDKVGRGCSLPADTMTMGYDVRTSCMKARAVELGPFCILDLVRKNIHREYIQMMWSKTPDLLKAQFARQLLRDVITYGKFKWSAAQGIPMSSDVGYFPALAAGGPDIGMMRRIANVVEPYGWAMNSGIPSIDGMVPFQMYMGYDSLEWAVEVRKNTKGYKIETTRTINDKMFGTTAVYEGIQMITEKRQLRGVLVPTGAGAHEFVEIEPTRIVPADAEGFKEIPNEDYEKDYVVLNGDRRRVFEVGFYIHPKALVRESLGSMPSMPDGKSFNRKFDMSLNPMTETQLGNLGCNPDLFFFGYRGLHAYAIKRRDYELAGAFLYIAPHPRYDVIDPWVSTLPAADPDAVTPRDLLEPQSNTCEPAKRPTVPAVREPVDITCSELFPSNGVGLMAFRQTGYDVEESAGNITLVVDRYGGSTGAASVVITISEGTATNPENFTTPSGFAGSGPWTKTLSWADLEDGPKTVVVPIVEAAGDDSGKTFTAALGTPSGATVGAKSSTTVTILDDDQA